jgi:flagellar motor protein MotB
LEDDASKPGEGKDEKGKTEEDAGVWNAGGSGSAWADLLKDATKALIPVLLTGASLIGFIAFAGAVIVWTRLYAIQVPPEQAVKAVPQDELVATGSSLLLLFGFFGVLTLVAAYLIDRGARATPGMSRALLALLALEGATAIWMFDGSWQPHTIVAVALFALLVSIAFAATFLPFFAEYKDMLPARPEETQCAVRGPGPLRKANGEPRVSSFQLRLAFGVLLLVLGLVAVLVFAASAHWLEVVLLILLGCFALILAGLLWAIGKAVLESWTDEREQRDAVRPQGGVTAPAGDTTVATGERLREEAEAKRLSRHRPHRLKVTPVGVGLFGGLAALAVALPSALVDESLLAVPLGGAMVLGIGVWRIAVLSKLNFMWFGLAVFISVPLFGTFTLMSRNFADPQVQPVAIIRSTDGPDESIQGIYVTEGDDRVYFANVATEGCEDEITEHSGRLLWVPKSEVVAMSVGPLQDVDDAGLAALEMAYALTPNVETPAGDHVSLSAAELRFEQETTSSLPPAEPLKDEESGGEDQGEDAEKDSEEEGSEEAEATTAEPSATGLDQRLADPGPAVRPNFGSGLTLVPEVASPGEEVELRLSVPNEADGVEGFGSRPEGHTLRLGGVPVSILRAGTRQAFDAEYLKTTDNRVLSLDKQGVYGLEGNEPRLLEEESYEGPRYVKLEDSRVESVEGGLEGDSEFLLIKGNGAYAHLVGTPKVKLVGEVAPVPLDERFLRQAWEKDRIRFRVPENAATGVVTVECGQLGGAPLLRVSRPPTARIAVHMRSGSRKVRFDARRSSDDGKIVLRRWTIGGLPRGKDLQVTRSLPPRLAPYKVQLTVTDADGETDTAELRLLRMPAASFRFGDDKPERLRLVRRLRRAVEREAAEESPAAIEIDGHADDVGTRKFNLELSWKRALNVRDALIDAERATLYAVAPMPVSVKARGFGETCPIDTGGGRSRRNRRVEVFVLGSGTRVAFPRTCHPGRVSHTSW